MHILPKDREIILITIKPNTIPQPLAGALQVLKTHNKPNLKWAPFDFIKTNCRDSKYFYEEPQNFYQKADFKVIVGFFAIEIHSSYYV
jgi:triacylglycerol esterase/lipase EstA (alpha/beta hydrolase family)